MTVFEFCARWLIQIINTLRITHIQYHMFFQNNLILSKNNIKSELLNFAALFEWHLYVHFRYLKQFMAKSKDVTDGHDCLGLVLQN